MDERVLVVPTAVLHEVGLFQGFTREVERYLPRLLDPGRLSFRPRSEAETDPAFKQLIPYVVLRCGNLLFHYTRGRGGTEARLHALRSLGIGGHVCAEDATVSADAYRRGMLREIAEEVSLETTYREHCAGLINDDGNAVGRVHLGIVHVFDLAEPEVRRREDVLTRCGFAALTELKAQRAEFETWSRFVLDELE